MHAPVFFRNLQHLWRPKEVGAVPWVAELAWYPRHRYPTLMFPPFLLNSIWAEWMDCGTVWVLGVRVRKTPLTRVVKGKSETQPSWDASGAASNLLEIGSLGEISGVFFLSSYIIVWKLWFLKMYNRSCEIWRNCSKKRGTREEERKGKERNEKRRIK